ARRAQALISDSDSTRQDILARLGVPQERVHVVPLAVDNRLAPAPEQAQSQVRQRYHLPETFLLYLGGFDRRKNLATLFRALAQLRDRLRPPPVLAIAGRLATRESRVVSDPRRQASEAGVSDLVRYLGWISPAEKPALYSAASAFAFPSSYEGFGLPPLEAMACGTPVVASDSSSLPEVVGPGGLLVAPDDSEAWSEALASLLEDDSKRETLGSAALAHSRRFSWRRTAEATAAVYQRTKEASA
ncbi:MAG: glycosyltransferase family 4 protein, partial [Anaerolineae bacterium]